MKKTKLSMATLLCLISFQCIKCQEIKPSKNALYIEFLGSGGLYSVNYEREFIPNLYGRIGFCTFAVTDMLSGGGEANTRITVFPIMLAYLTGKGKSHFEISGGMLLGLETETNASYSIIDATAFIGYRYQPPGDGFIFRIGFTPILSLDNESDYPATGFLASGGLSLGYHF